MEDHNTIHPLTEKELSRKPMRILIAGFTVSVVVLTLFSLISFIQIRRERTVSDWIVNSFTVKLKVRESVGFLNYAQAQHRAFLLTSDSGFYRSYLRSVNWQKQVNKQLDSSIGGYSAQVINLRKFKDLSERRALQMERVLDSSRVLSLRGLIPMLAMGAQIMDTLNRQVHKIEVEEDEHLKFRLGQKERREKNISAWILGFSVIALVTIVVSFLILRTQRYRLSKIEINKMQLEGEVEKRTKEILEANKELQEKNAELKERNAELNNFTFISGHDMKEPLRKTQTFLKLILEEDGEKLSVASKEYADRILVSIGHMSKLIDAILVYVKVTRKKEKEPVDLNKAVEWAIGNLEKYIREKSAIINYETLPVINAVPGQMESLFCIFISNSLKFSKDDPRIQINCTLDTISDKPAWKIEFSDNGIGFDMKYNDKIFKIFQRLHAKDEYPGTGLGLALAKRIVENHGGMISANSEVGKGATFTILIPCAEKAEVL